MLPLAIQIVVAIIKRQKDKGNKKNNEKEGNDDNERKIWVVFYLIPRTRVIKELKKMAT